MKFRITENGNLEFSIDQADRDDLQHLLETTDHLDHGFMAGMIERENWNGNGRLYQIRPEWIAALTDAPIVSDELVLDDNAMASHVGNVWWYPNYAVSSFAEALLRDGRVTFDAAPENEIQRSSRSHAASMRG